MALTAGFVLMPGLTHTGRAGLQQSYMIILLARPRRGLSPFHDVYIFIASAADASVIAKLASATDDALPI